MSSGWFLYWVESDIEESIVGKEGDKVKLIILKDKDNENTI